jgi:hypothetical protein
VYAARSLAFERCFGSIGCGPGNLCFPEGCCTHEKTLYVADCFNHRICTFHFDGTFRSAIGCHGLGAGQLTYPCDVAVARERLIVVEEQRVQVLRLSGAPQQVLTLGVEVPRPAPTDAYTRNLLCGLCGLCVRGSHVLVTDLHARVVHAFRLREPRELAA